MSEIDKTIIPAGTTSIRKIIFTCLTCQSKYYEGERVWIDCRYGTCCDVELIWGYRS